MLELSEHELMDQVKIEDQGDFMIRNTPRSLSDNEESFHKEEEVKQRHLFYMKNIHEDHQDLSNIDNNDYLKFYTTEKVVSDPKNELKMLL